MAYDTLKNKLIPIRKKNCKYFTLIFNSFINFQQSIFQIFFYAGVPFFSLTIRFVLYDFKNRFLMLNALSNLIYKKTDVADKKNLILYFFKYT